VLTSVSYLGGNLKEKVVLDITDRLAVGHCKAWKERRGTAAGRLGSWLWQEAACECLGAAGNSRQETRKSFETRNEAVTAAVYVD
jgi:hypothetical protein